MIQDFILENFGIDEQLAGGGEPVLVTLAPLIRNRISSGVALSSWYNSLCLDYFPYMYYAM
jgi:hypothetical protein